MESLPGYLIIVAGYSQDGAPDQKFVESEETPVGARVPEDLECLVHNFRCWRIHQHDRCYSGHCDCGIPSCSGV